jgi:hypothetical protein
MKTRNKSVECKDGFIMSVQAGGANYCSPRDDDGPYVCVEVGFPSEREELLMPYIDGRGSDEEDDPTECVYGHVPVEVITAIIMKHGGMVDGQLPHGVDEARYVSGTFHKEENAEW